MFYKLQRALEATVQTAHRCDLPAVAGQLHSVGAVTDQQGLTRLEDRIITVSKLLRLRPVPKDKVDKLGAAVKNLAEAMNDARYM